MKQLKRIRELKKISQRELAERSSVHYTTIARLETGKLNPSLVTLKKLAKALGVKVEELVKERR